MDWDNIERMDPHLLVGVVNTELRNHCESLEDLCLTHDVDRALLVSRLESAGYQYFSEQKRFG